MATRRRSFLEGAGMEAVHYASQYFVDVGGVITLKPGEERIVARRLKQKLQAG